MTSDEHPRDADPFSHIPAQTGALGIYSERRDPAAVNLELKANPMTPQPDNPPAFPL